MIRYSVAILLCILYFAPAYAQDTTLHFLTLADIHFDPFASCGSAVPCPVVEKLRRAPVAEWHTILAAEQGAVAKYKQDTNYALLASALATAKQVANKEQVKFVLVLGDFISHEFRRAYKKYAKDKTQAGYQTFVYKTLAFINQELAQAFPTADIYAVVGNHDSYQGNYITNVDGRFFKETAQLWSGLIKNPANAHAMQKQHAQAGYYALTLSREPGLRLIVLNTTVFSYKAKGKNIDKIAAEQLDWLHEQLQLAKSEKQRVLIAMHIPIGVDVYASLRIRLFTLIEFWKTVYLQRFQAELRDYAPQVAGIFAGHLHADWMQMLTFNHKDEIPVTGTPSISPIFGNNPGFKLYTYSAISGHLENFVVYYYALHHKNEWGIEYNFNQIYQSNCHDCRVADGINKLEPGSTLAEFYKQFYSVGTESQPITQQWYPHYWCGIWETERQHYKDCIE